MRASRPQVISQAALSKERSKKSVSLGAYFLLICLISPIAGALLRKFVPGQPAWLRLVGFGFIALLAIWSFTRKGGLSRWAATPLLIWGIIQFIYVIPTALFHFKLSFLISIIYFFPLFLSRSAAVGLKSEDDLLWISKWFGYLALICLPLGILVAIRGNEFLPDWLRAVYTARHIGLEFAKGAFPVPSLIWGTASELAHTMLAITYLSLMGLELARSRGESTQKWWIFVIASVVLAYLSGRRGIFLGCLVGMAFSYLRGSKLDWRKVVALVGLSGTIWWVDRVGQSSSYAPSRAETYDTLPFWERFTDIFLRLTLQWLDAMPFGSFLGHSSPAADAMGITLDHAVEVGAASLVVDMGVFGLLVFPACIGVLCFQMYIRSRRLRCSAVVAQLILFELIVFTLFYFKAATLLNIGALDMIFFWLAPGIAAFLIKHELDTKRAYWAPKSLIKQPNGSSSFK